MTMNITRQTTTVIGILAGLILLAGSLIPWNVFRYAEWNVGKISVVSPDASGMFDEKVKGLGVRGIRNSRLIFILSGDWTHSTRCVFETYVVSNRQLVLTSIYSVGRLSRSSRPGDPRVMRFREGVACGETENHLGDMVPVLQGVGGLGWSSRSLYSTSGLTNGFEQRFDGPLEMGKRRIVFVRSSEPVSIVDSEYPSEIAEKAGEGALVVYGMLEVPK